MYPAVLTHQRTGGVVSIQAGNHSLGDLTARAWTDTHPLLLGNSVRSKTLLSQLVYCIHNQWACRSVGTQPQDRGPHATVQTHLCSPTLKFENFLFALSTITTADGSHLLSWHCWQGWEYADSIPGSDGNKEVLRIPQRSSTAGTSPSDCLVSYPGHSFGGGLTPLQRCSQCILQPFLRVLAHSKT